VDNSHPGPGTNEASETNRHKQPSPARLRSPGSVRSHSRLDVSASTKPATRAVAQQYMPFVLLVTDISLSTCASYDCVFGKYKYSDESGVNSGFWIDEFIETACLRVITIAENSFLSCSAVNQREKRKKELKLNDVVFSLK
jgi:hypothetical protein